MASAVPGRPIVTTPGGWLPVEQAAAELGLRPTYVVHLLRAGERAGRREGGHWLADPSAVQQRASEHDRWISYASAAEIVGCSTVTIGKAVRDGRLEHRPGGRRVASILRASAEQLAGEWQAAHETARKRRAARAAAAAGAPQDGHVWLDTETAALVLGISASRVRQLARRDSLPFTTRGKSRLWFRRDHVEQVAAARARWARQHPAVESETTR